jgi:hypothetical protein
VVLPLWGGSCLQRAPESVTGYKYEAFTRIMFAERHLLDCVHDTDRGHASFPLHLPRRTRQALLLEFLLSDSLLLRRLLLRFRARSGKSSSEANLLLLPRRTTTGRGTGAPGPRRRLQKDPGRCRGVQRHRPFARCRTGYGDNRRGRRVGNLRRNADLRIGNRTARSAPSPIAASRPAHPSATLQHLSNR